MATKEITAMTDAVIQAESAFDKAKRWLITTGKAEKMSSEEIDTFLELASEFRLNPFKKEIHAALFKGKLTPITGYEVFIRRATRSGQLDGWEWKTQGTVVREAVEGGFRVNRFKSTLTATVKIWRKDWNHPFEHTISILEFCGSGPIWNSIPEFMLKKTCASQAFRLAFPDENEGMPDSKEEFDTYSDVDDHRDLSFLILEAEEIAKHKVEHEDIKPLVETIKEFVSLNDAKGALRHYQMLKAMPDKPDFKSPPTLLPLSNEHPLESTATDELVTAPEPEISEMEKAYYNAEQGLVLVYSNQEDRDAAVLSQLKVRELRMCDDYAALLRFVEFLRLKFKEKPKGEPKPRKKRSESTPQDSTESPILAPLEKLALVETVKQAVPSAEQDVFFQLISGAKTHADVDSIRENLKKNYGA